MKKFVLILITAMVLILTGCSGVDYSIFQMSEGTILEVFSILNDPSYFVNAGATLDQTVKFNREGLALLSAQAIVSESSYDFKLQKQIEEGTIKDGEKLKNGLTVEVGTDENNNIIMRFKYKNMDCYKFFNDILKQDKVEVKRNFFTVDYVLANSTTKYASLVTDGDNVITLGQKIYKEFDKLVIKHMGNEVLEKLTRPTLNYVYVTDLKRLHSDADYVASQDGLYVHMWALNEQSTERKIMLYRTEANRGVFYSLILGSTIIVVATIYGIITYKEKKTKEKS